MSESKFRVGIVGAGYVADYHIKALRALPDVEIVALRTRTNASSDDGRAVSDCGRVQVAR